MVDEKSELPSLTRLNTNLELLTKEVKFTNERLVDGLKKLDEIGDVAYDSRGRLDVCQKAGCTYAKEIAVRISNVGPSMRNWLVVCTAILSIVLIAVGWGMSK